MSLSRFIWLAVAVLASLVVGAPATDSTTPNVKGFYLPYYNAILPQVDFKKAYSSGGRFAFIRSGCGGLLEHFHYARLWFDAKDANIIRGSVHRFHANSTVNATEQAKDFATNRGRWTDDGFTLPGSLHLEAFEDGEHRCHGLAQDKVVEWVSDFVDEYHSVTGRYPFIFTSQPWWDNCTSNSDAFKDKCPLILINYGKQVGVIPGGWKEQTFWQYGKVGAWGALADEFNGDEAALKKLADGT